MSVDKKTCVQLILLFVAAGLVSQHLVDPCRKTNFLLWFTTGCTAMLFDFPVFDLPRSITFTSFTVSNNNTASVAMLI